METITNRETKIASIEKRTEYSVYCKHYVTSFVPDVEEVKEFIDAHLDIMNKKPFLTLIDLSDNYINWTTPAKDFLSKHIEFSTYCQLMAIVVNSLPTRLILNLYLSYFKPSVKVNFFATVEEASKFLDKKEKQLFN